ncbi:HEPN domain-containing protein [Anditalea andensis]|uniref:HEPN domain-containing protein n=1 Tax=Anditalea andensis TaxID=1048983 RepID=A0A074L5Y0_9BACT|nr:HEPN domain-containing protein [Anditalea andensis]KEO75238.1 hypothetical protein EL17_06160 [Anditalea andensis]
MQTLYKFNIGEEALARIRQSASAKAVFLLDRTCFGAENFLPGLLLALSTGSTLPRKRAREQVLSTGLLPEDQIQLAFCHIDELKAGLRRGALFHHLHLSPARLMASDVAFTFPYISKELLKEKYTEAYSRFGVVIKRAMAFKQGAALYSEQNDYTTACFMLHQSIELGFSAAEQFALGKAKKSHKLMCHILSAQFYAPPLASIFLNPGHGLSKPLELLEKAYLGARYRDNFVATKDHVGRLSNVVDKFYDQLLKLPNTYRETINDFDPEKQINLPKTPVKMEKISQEKISLMAPGVPEHLTDFITGMVQKFEVSHVFCFGLHDHRRAVFSPFAHQKGDGVIKHDLLVLTMGSDATAIQQYCQQWPAKGHRLFTIVHEVSEVRERLLRQERFFHSVIFEGQLFYGDALTLKCTPLETDNREWRHKNAVKVFQTRMKRAKTFMKAAEEVLKHDGGEVAVYLMYQCIHQLCLGLIYAQMEYDPKFQSLPHLLSLCSNFTDLFEQHFPQENANGHKQANMLIESYSGTRFKHGYHISNEEAVLLYDKLAGLPVNAEKLLKKYL